MRTGAWLFIAGHDPERRGQLAYRGRIGRSVAVAEAGAALKLATLNALASARAAVGPLTRFRCVLLTGFVASATVRGLDPAILGESLRLLATVLPATDRPAVWLRPAQGLAGGMPVEVELVLEARRRGARPPAAVSRQQARRTGGGPGGARGTRRSGARTS